LTKHRKFNADRFLDKFEGQEVLLRHYVGQWDGQIPLSCETLDVPMLKGFLAHGDGDGKDAMMEGLYRAYDLCTEPGHEHLVSACRDCGYQPDANGELPVECLSLKVLTEHEDAFNLAYDRNALETAERFSLYRGKAAQPIADPDSAARAFQERLAETFQKDKHTERVLVRFYREGPYLHFIVYHEKRTRAELVFTGTKAHPRVSPTIFRPAQQDFVSYNEETGQLEIEARFEQEEAALRTQFAACCLGDAEFFEAPAAAKRLNLARIGEPDFSLPVDEDYTAALVELHFMLKQQYGPSFVVRSKGVLETLDLNSLRRRLAGGAVRRAVFRIGFPDDRRGKRVELAGTNTITFKRATHAEDVFRYLRNWGVLRA